MSMPHKVDKLLWDVRTCIEDIDSFLKGKTFEDFSSERLLQAAVEREFEIIGEALNRLFKLDEERVRQKISQFHEIIGLRNIIAHGYDSVDVKALWDISHSELLQLKKQINEY
jgi:uncharacterized protein with HEPN domain